MKNTQFHSQENMAINNCGLQEFDLLLQERQEHFNRILMFHLYINSLQNKFDGLKLLNDETKSQIIFLSEIKIDKSQICTIVCPKPNSRKLGVKKEMAKFGH